MARPRSWLTTSCTRSAGEGAPQRIRGHGACFIEIGGGRAGFGSGNFFAEPAPRVRLRPPGRCSTSARSLTRNIGSTVGSEKPVHAERKGLPAT